MTNKTVHRNGGGAIFGIAAAVGSDCMVDASSEIRGASFVSCLSVIADHSVIDTTHVVSSSIERSVILDSHIAEAEIEAAGLRDVVVRGATGQVAHLKNVILSGHVVVENCSLENTELDGPFLVHSDWTRTPRHRVLRTSNGIVQGLIECGMDNDHFHSGCECRPFSLWDKNEYLLRRHFVGQLNWPLDSFNSIRTTFEQWRREDGKQ